jgi:hypothetical protein
MLAGLLDAGTGTRGLGGMSRQKLRRVLQLTFSDWRYLAVACLELFAARIRLAAVTTDKILGKLQAPLSVGLGSSSLEVRRLAWAIAIAAQYVPWRSDCLVQVLAADRWLRRHHLQPDFYLGVAKDERGGLAAHAWLRYGDIIVTGGRADPFATLIGPTAK